MTGSPGAGGAAAVTVGAVLATWRSVLDLPVRPDTSFFQVGGSSLLAARIALELRRWSGRAVTTRMVLEAGSPERLAVAASAAPPARETDSWASVGAGAAPASVQQSVIWFLEQLDPDNVAYNTTATVTLDGPVDPDRLRRAAAELLQRHGVLRTAFGTVDGELTQLPERPVEPVFEVVDLTGSGQPDAGTVAVLVRDLGRVRFDPARPPLLRWTLLRVAADRWLLVQTEHHFVHDGWSMWLLLSDLALLYRDGPAAPAPPDRDAYRRFGRWQREWLAGPDADRQRRWWTAALAGCLEPLRFPRDGGRPAVFDSRGGTVEWGLPADVAAQVHRCSARWGVTPFSVLMAGFAATVGGATDSNCFALGSMLRNRRSAEAQTTVGMLVNTIALPVRDWPRRSFRELTATTAGLLADAEDHQELPFPLVVDQLRPARDLSRNPVFQACFSLNDWPEPWLDLGPGVRAEVRFPSNGGAKFDLDVVVLPEPSGWRMLWRHYAAVLDPTETAALADRYADVLRRATADPDVPLREVAMPPVERR